jgi:hypothetical protein
MTQRRISSLRIDLTTASDCSRAPLAIAMTASTKISI